MQNDHFRTALIASLTDLATVQNGGSARSSAASVAHGE
jgi:hypothetical protein